MLEEQSKYLSSLTCRNPVEIRFENLTYVVSDGCFKEEKIVLHNVCGKFPAKKLVAIMGPSGAGKSSLLDLLSGYRITGIDGKVIINGKSRLLNEFRKISCYIQQDDRLQPLLTVQENMSIAADLKLGPEVTSEKKETLISEIISILGLRECRHTRGAQLSGGQKKRLSIALELVNNPMVMFLDEPTTGLDSQSCSQCISLLRMLAHQGRTIICTIHQPSSNLFQMFDQVYILARGKCLYQGTPDNMIRYLTSLRFPCPKYHNPADYVIELASGEYGDDKIGAMVNGVNNGKSLQWFRNSKVLCDYEFKEEVRMEPDGKKKKKHQADKEYMMSTSQLRQFSVLLRRGYIKLKRDSTLTHMRIMVNLIVSLMLSMLYVNSGEDANKVLDNYNLLFSLIMHLVMSSMMLNVLTVPLEISILMKEHFNRWYSLKAYYAATNILDIPAAAFSCIMFTTIVYFATNQLFEWNRFLIFTATSLLLVFISQSIGYIVGTVFNVINGTFTGPIFMIPMMMFSGFGVNLRDIPFYLKWGTYISFLRYALEAYVEAIYGFDRKPFTCYVPYCHYKFPEKFLHEVAMNDIDVTYNLWALVITLLIVRLLGYCTLSWKVRLGR